MSNSPDAITENMVKLGPVMYEANRLDVRSKEPADKTVSWSELTQDQQDCYMLGYVLGLREGIDWLDKRMKERIRSTLTDKAKDIKFL